MSKEIFAFVLVMGSLATFSAAVLQPMQLTENQMVAAALIPLPEPLRIGAGVVRLDETKHPQIIRKSANGMVCIADPPGDAVFDVRCYEEHFIEVVYRAFQLGYTVSGPKVEEEIKAGQLHLSNDVTAGYRCLGPASGYNPSTNTISSEIDCWESIHFPFRTARQIGLPEMNDISADLRRRVPYVMSSGLYWAHVMIEHPKKN